MGHLPTLGIFICLFCFLSFKPNAEAGLFSIFSKNKELADERKVCSTNYSVLGGATNATASPSLPGVRPLLPSQINYKIFGEQNKETLVLVHGLDSAWQTFDNIIPKLAEKYKVVVYDQRGHGLTAAVGKLYDSSVMAKDLESLLDHLKLEKVHLLGHSMGARTVAQFASRHPGRVSSLVLEDMELVARTKLDDAAKAKVVEDAAAIERKFGDRKFASEQALLDALSSMYGPEEAASLIKRRARANADGTYDLLFRPDVSLLYAKQANAEDLMNTFREYRGPTLFMQADERLGSAVSGRGLKAVEDLGPHRPEIVRIEGAGHTVHRSQEDKFMSAVLGFLGNKPISQVATEGTEDLPELRKLGMLPRGSALLTSSGDLEKTGIRHIIHAASGAMTRSGGFYEPTLESIGSSVKNSIALAKAHGHKSIAMPFIGGQIFAGRIGVSPEEIARTIVKESLKHSGGMEVNFVTFGAEATNTFKQLVEEIAPGNKSLNVLEGSITDFGLHKSSAIVNAANMEVQFGGGVSGAIGKATGQARKIDLEAEGLIKNR